MRIFYAVSLALLFAVTTPGGVAAEDTEKSLAEQREELRKRCQQVIPEVQRLPLQQRKELASLVGKVDEELKGAKRVLNGPVHPLAPPETIVRQFLKDGNWFLDDVMSCVEATKQDKACSISPDSRTWIYTDLEDVFLRKLPTFCRT